MELPLLLRRPAIEEALAEGRGQQKVIVTSFYPREVPLTTPVWQGQNDAGQRPVLLAQNLELAVFNERAPQDRHFHRHATECYTVLAGSLTIEAAGEHYPLSAGDTLVLPPGIPHEVLRTTPFLAQVIIANCSGPTDKFLAPHPEPPSPRR